MATREVPNVLFLCTGNSARSIMAEALLDHLGSGHFKGRSAGSRPTGRVNPLTLDTLRAAGVPVGGLRSKSWDEFAPPGAPRLEAVVTLCDSAAAEACPVWPGQPATAHWGLADPAACAGSDGERRAAFRRALGQIETCLRALVAGEPAGLDLKAALGAAFDPARRLSAAP